LFDPGYVSVLLGRKFVGFKPPLNPPPMVNGSVIVGAFLV